MVTGATGNGEGVYGFDAHIYDNVGNRKITNIVYCTYDTTAPTVTITADPSANPTNASSITYTFDWSEVLENNSFTADDITVTNGTKGAFTATTQNKTYTLVVNNSGSCTQSVSVAAGKCKDFAGNNNAASATYSVTIDRDPPNSGNTSLSATATRTGWKEP